MKKLRCTVCNYIYDEENEARNFQNYQVIGHAQYAMRRKGLLSCYQRNGRREQEKEGLFLMFW